MNKTAPIERTYTFNNGSELKGFEVLEDEQCIEVKLSQVYETDKNIWLPGNVKRILKNDLAKIDPK